MDTGSPPPEPAGSAVTQPPRVLGLLGCWVVLTFAPRCTHRSKFTEAQNTLEGRPRSLEQSSLGNWGHAGAYSSLYDSIVPFGITCVY